MVIFGIPFNFANIIVVPLLIGLGVASGIHLVMRARKNRDDLMGTSTPRAVLFSALTTVASFGSLSVSGHRGTASMGELLTIAISLTLICALVVLPGLVGLVGVGRSSAPDKPQDRPTGGEAAS
jgi:predicted RND superfamily exporter protein